MDDIQDRDEYKDENVKSDAANNQADDRKNCDDEIKELEKKIQELALEIDKVEDEKLNTENLLKKALADYVNLEKSMEKRSEIMMNELKRRAAADLIEIVDDISYGLTAKDELQIPKEIESWIDGIVSTLNKANKALLNLNIKLMDIKIGEKFDPMKHEAIGVVYEGEKDTIRQVLQPGYMMGDQIVRPARVIVSKGENNEFKNNNSDSNKPETDKDNNKDQEK